MNDRRTSERYQSELRGSFRDLTKMGHERWMEENNPDGWDTETWRAFSARIASDSAFKDLVRSIATQRRSWVGEELARRLRNKQATVAFRYELRQDIAVEAELKFPRPHPTADGWAMWGRFDPMSAIGKG